MKSVHTLFAVFLLTLCLGCQSQPQNVTIERDVSYGKADGQDLLLDVFYPKAPAKTPMPAVIFVHGGGWHEGSKEDFKDGAQALAQQGYVTFSINYRLAKNGHNHWPAQLDDAQRAVRWVRAHADKYHLDPQRVGAIGHSAGGHLVTCLGTRDTRDNSDPTLAKYSSRVTCVVDMSGPVDLVKRENTQGDGILYNFLGGKPEQVPDLARDASPLYFIDAKTVPFLIIHGRQDTLVPPQQAERLNATLHKTGIESKLLIFENENHGISHQDNADRMIQAVLAFLKQHLSP